jgi:serine/threonine protein kinase
MPVVFDTDLTTVVDMTRAKNIAVHKIDKSIWHLQDSDRILKRGPNVRVSEAEALRFIASSTHVPVPEVFGAYEKDGFGNIFMSRVIGTPLYDVLYILDKAQVERLTAQLSGFVRSWMGLRGDFFGSMGFKACRDVFFQHLPAANMPDREYGPFRSRTEYCNGLVDALQNSRPGGQFDANDAHLIERIQRLDDGCAVFCHGDLTPDNILVDDQMNVVAIVDMGVSGFSIPEREYFEAKSRARNPVWSSMIDQIIPKISDGTYALLSELELELVRYSGL